MGRTSRKLEPAPVAPGWVVTACGLLFAAVEVVVIPGASSPFRLPKEALAVGGLVVLGALVCLLKARAFELPRGPLTVVLAALPILAAISALWAASPRTALLTAAASAVWVASAVTLAQLGRPTRRRIAIWTSLGVLASALAMVAERLGSPLLEIEPSGTASRLELTGLTGNPADLALAAVLLLPLLVSALVRAHPAGRRWLLPVVLAVASLATRTLTAAVAVATMVVVIAIVTPSRKLRIAVTVAALLALCVVPFTPLGTRLMASGKRLAQGDLYDLFSARADGWTAAAEMIIEHPLTGVGAGHFDRAYYPARVAWLTERGEVGQRGELATHFEWAHCEPLQVVAELGAPGWLWLSGLLAALGWHWRRTDSPLIALSACAVVPFVLIHYPARLAVGLVPLTLIAAALLAREPKVRLEIPTLAGRRALCAAAVTVAAAIIIWQSSRVSLDRWRGQAESRLTAAARLQPAARAQVLTDLERQALGRVDGVTATTGDLWRLVGRARLLRDAPRPAEAAFQTAMTVWPHEEAEFGLGLALAAQGRRVEAVAHLTRVCRTNPSLTALITDSDLRQTVEEALNAIARSGHG